MVHDEFQIRILHAHHKFDSSSGESHNGGHMKAKMHMCDFSAPEKIGLP